MFVWSIIYGKALQVAPDSERQTETEESNIVMKLKLVAVMAAASLLAIGTAFAQNCPGTGPRGQGKGYGGPPQSVEERAARQSACLQLNGGICPQGGPRAECPGLGQGKRMGKGQGQGRGLRDGTGPRSVDGTCPLGSAGQQRGRR